MPSQIDNTYHNEYSKPTYDTVEDQIRQQRIREADYILDSAIPPVPDRQMELDYMQWLQEDIKQDPWLSLRYKKLMAGPKRVPFKNYKELRDDYRRQFIINFLAGAMIGWPLAVIIGRRAQRYQGGVGVVPYQRWVHDWPNVCATRTNRKFFRRYSLLTMCVTGTLFARQYTDNTGLKNEWYTRPDLKPKAAMVTDPTDYDPVAFKQMQQQSYGKYKSHREGVDYKKSTWYRIFRPLSADFEIKENLYTGRNASLNYKDGKFPTYQHDYSDHTN